MLLPGAAQTDLEAPLASFAENGFARLGLVMDPGMLAQLRERADATMLAETNDLHLFFQHDPGTGRYEDLEYGQG